ncbi:hypothetical protein NXH76_29120 [Blautia schinkii]|nr:hypothetical protein [Blautia schinkii]
MKIALIDDTLSGCLTEVAHIESYQYIRGRFTISNIKKNPSTISHSAICLEILESLLDIEHKILHIQIISPEEIRGTIQGLTDAMLLCIEKEVDIICLSVGSLKLSDSTLLYPVIKKLIINNIVIVASQSNLGYRTLPALYDEVVGVISDNTGELSYPDFRLLPSNPFGINMLVPYFNTEGLIGKSVCGNSFASPVAVAIIAQGFTKSTDVLKQLQLNTKYPLLSHSESASWLFKTSDMIRKPLEIDISSEDYLNSNFMSQVLDCLRNEFEIEAIWATDYYSEDVRIINYPYEVDLFEQLNDHLYAFTDFVFYYGKQKWDREYEANLVLNADGFTVYSGRTEIINKKTQSTDEQGYIYELCGFLNELFADME